MKQKHANVTIVIIIPSRIYVLKKLDRFSQLEYPDQELVRIKGKSVEFYVMFVHPSVVKIKNKFNVFKF